MACLPEIIFTAFLIPGMLLHLLLEVWIRGQVIVLLFELFMTVLPVDFLMRFALVKFWGKFWE